MSGVRRGPPATVFWIGSLAALFFLVSYGSDAFSNGFTTGRIVRLVIWAVWLIVCVVQLGRIRKSARNETGDGSVSG